MQLIRQLLKFLADLFDLGSMICRFLNGLSRKKRRTDYIDAEFIRTYPLAPVPPPLPTRRPPC